MSVLSTIRRWFGIEGRADVYNPIHPRDGALHQIFSGGAGSSAGVAVTMDSAVTVAAVYAAARVLAETVASVPLVLFSRSGRERRRETDDPLYRLLHTRPNPEMTSAVFRETLVYNGALGGNALAEIERNGAGAPVALWPLLADRTRRVESQGKFFYVTTLRNGEQRALSREQVLHVPIAGATGMWGPSIVALARDALGSAIAAQDFSGRFFANGLHTGGFFRMPAPPNGKPLSDPALKRWKEGIKQWQEGLTNAHRYMILEEGMEWQQPGVSPEHAQLIETRKFQVNDVARWFRMPPHLIQDLERATFTNIEHQDLEFVKYTMLPWFTKLEQEITEQLIGDDPERFFAFVIQGLLRGDHAGRATFYQQMLQNGVLSPNEVRELEDQNPRPGGDRFMRPANMVEIDEKGVALPLPRDPAPPRTERVSSRNFDVFRPLFEGAARRITAKEQAERVKLTSDEQAALFRSLVEREIAPLFAAVGAEWTWNDPEPLSGVGGIAEQRAEAWFERACALAREGE